MYVSRISEEDEKENRAEEKFNNDWEVSKSSTDEPDDQSSLITTG